MVEHFSLVYEEDEGTMIPHAGKEFWVYGSCSGTWKYCNVPHKSSEPDESWSELVDFDYDINRIEDSDGNRVDIRLTTEELDIYITHMKNCLEELR